MSYSIRKTKISDVSNLPSIERSASQIFLSVPHLAWIADAPVTTPEEHIFYFDRGLSWVAEESSSKKLIGFILADNIQDDLYIVEVSMRASYQNQGIGTGLIRTVFAEAAALKKKSITLTTFKDLPWNAPYYERLGFEYIPKEEIDAYLEVKLKNEITAGFDGTQRCVMRKINTALN